MSVHTTHSQRDNPGRQKTYLIATYTGVIEAEDVEQDWFIPSDPESRDKRGVDCPAQREPQVLQALRGPRGLGGPPGELRPLQHHHVWTPKTGQMPGYTGANDAAADHNDARVGG